MRKPHEVLPVPFGWYGVAYSTELAPGDVRPLQYFGEEFVLFRTESGEVKAVEPYCPHLGAHLGYGGKVKGEHIACPFHAWEFDGAGVCQHIPYAKRIPPKIEGKAALYSYPVVEKNKVIWVWYHPQRVAPMFEVVELPEVVSGEWSDYRCFDWVVDAHVQETAENAADAAHFAYVHSAQNVPQGTVEHVGFQRHARFESQTPEMDEQGNLDRTGTRWRPSVLETSSCGPGQTWQRFTGLFDTMMLGLITPISTQQLHMRFAFTQRKGLNATQQLMADAMMTEICRQVEQDIPIWKHKVYRPDPVLCDGDGPINQFRKWFRQFYAEPV